ncbi:MAG TPA: 50S ribosomal protein L5 [Candidatus Nanoarchaeia archaeon]|nr:50S ribosomal protein L5 [Candidatus Nanoarchaeia archaeon]
MTNLKGINIEKVTLNIGVGQPGDKLEKAMKLLKTITGAKPIQTKTMKRIPSWGIRPRLAIASKVTIRGKKAEELLKRLLDAVDNVIPEKKFDLHGNFSFGIQEYINISNVNYDVEVGIIGLEVAVTFTRPGYRIQKRLLKKSKISKNHKLKREEVIQYMKDNFKIKTGEEE